MILEISTTETMDKNQQSEGAVGEDGGGVSSTTPSYRVTPHIDASCEASTVQGPTMLNGNCLSNRHCDTYDTLSTLPGIDPSRISKPLLTLNGINGTGGGPMESQEPSTMMFRLLNMSMSEETSKAKSFHQQIRLPNQDKVDVIADSTAAGFVDESDSSSNESLTRQSNTTSSQGAGTVSMLSVDNEEATLGSILSERRLGTVEEEAVSNPDLTFKSALRSLMQQQGNGTSPAEEVRSLAASSSNALMNNTRGRLNNLGLLFQQQQQYNNRLLARKKVLVAAAGSRQRHLSILHRNGPLTTLRPLRSPTPLTRPQQSTATGTARSSIAYALAQSSSTSQQPTLYTAHPSKLKGGLELKIVIQPEEQHRARYLTEGSRGAVKDRTGNLFPTVKLTGTTQGGRLLVFIGSDQGRAVPHMFYQASKVCGKNSTPCEELRIDGTTVIQVAIPPQHPGASNASSVRELSVDCVGILKERNVDVEKRLARYGSLLPTSAFADNGNSSKKRSTRCRLVFRVILDSGETLQTSSAPILCTQPPGAPEICKKSLKTVPCDGGQADTELYIIGKNFLKDTKVIFREVVEGRVLWQSSVVPEKEFLQATHLVCQVPPYHRKNISQPVTVELVVASGGRCSDPSNFTYTPLHLESAQSNSIQQSQAQQSSSSSSNQNKEPTTGATLLSQAPQASPAILQIPVLSGTPASTSVSSTATANNSPATIQFVVVPTGAGQAQAVLNLIAGNTNGHQVSVQNVVNQAAVAQAAAQAAAQAQDQLSKSFEFANSSVLQQGPSKNVEPPQLVGSDSGIKRKISDEDVKPPGKSHSRSRSASTNETQKEKMSKQNDQLVTVPEEQMLTTTTALQNGVSQEQAQNTISSPNPAANWNTSPTQTNADLQVVWADTKQPMSATDQAAIQHIATSLAASAQNMEEATEDVLIKKQKVFLQESQNEQQQAAQQQQQQQQQQAQQQSQQQPQQLTPDQVSQLMRSSPASHSSNLSPAEGAPTAQSQLNRTEMRNGFMESFQANFANSLIQQQQQQQPQQPSFAPGVGPAQSPSEAPCFGAEQSFGQQNQIGGSPLQAQFQSFGRTASSPISAVANGSSGGAAFSPQGASNSPRSQYSNSSLGNGSFQGVQQQSSPFGANGSLAGSPGEAPQAMSQQSSQQAGQSPANQQATAQQNTFESVFSQIAAAAAANNQFGSSSVTPMDCQSAPSNSEVPMNVDMPNAAANRQFVQQVSPQTTTQTVITPSGQIITQSVSCQRQVVPQVASPVQASQMIASPQTMVASPNQIVSMEANQMSLTQPVLNGATLLENSTVPSQNFGMAPSNAANMPPQNALSAQQNGIPEANAFGQHSFTSMAAPPLNLAASQKMDLEHFVVPTNAVQEPQLVSNVGLANQLLASNGISFPRTVSSQSTRTVASFAQQVAEQMSQQHKEQGHMNMDTSIGIQKSQSNGALNQAIQAGLQQDHTGQKIINQNQQQVVLNQQMECQLQSMSMLPENELIRIINPDSFVERSQNQQNPTVLSMQQGSAGPSMF